MSAAHTPGPWVVNDLYAETEIRGPQNSGVMIAVMSPWGIAADEPSPQRANARLIAAAPELLAACNALIGLVQLVAGRLDLDPEVREALLCSHRLNEALDAAAKAEGVSRDDALHAASAAIAKATGAAP